MKDFAIDGLLSVAVLGAWIGALGFERLTAALDRLHAVSFTTISVGFPIVLAAFIADGLSPRAIKIAFLWLLALIAGAAVNQTVARAIFTRAEAGERM